MRQVNGVTHELARGALSDLDPTIYDVSSCIWYLLANEMN